MRPAVGMRSSTIPSASRSGSTAWWHRSPTGSSRTTTTSSTSSSKAAGVLEVEGEQVPVREGTAVFVEAGAEHRFTAYEHLSVLVIFERKPAGNP